MNGSPSSRPSLSRVRRISSLLATSTTSPALKRRSSLNAVPFLTFRGYVRTRLSQVVTIDPTASHRWTPPYRRRSETDPTPLLRSLRFQDPPSFFRRLQ